MNPRSLQEPEAAKAVAETTTDPVVSHASDEKLIALNERWRALLDEYSQLDEAAADMPEPEIDAAYDKMGNLVDEADMMGGRVVALPATTHRSLAMIAVVWMDAATIWPPGGPVVVRAAGLIQQLRRPLRA